MKRWILLSIAVVLAACAEAPVVRDDAPQAGIIAVQPNISGIDWKGIGLRFDIVLKNPYPVPIVAPRFAYDLDIGGVVFLSGKEGTNASIPASATGTVSLPVRILYEDLWRRRHDLFDANHVVFALRGQLVLYALGQSHNLPFFYTGQAPILRPLRIEPNGIRVVSHTATRAEVEVVADVTNPNMFAVDLRSTSFRFAFADLVSNGISVESPDEIGARLKRAIALRGEVTGSEATIRLLQEGSLGLPVVEAQGDLGTPHGAVRIP